MSTAPVNTGPAPATHRRRLLVSVSLILLGLCGFLMWQCGAAVGTGGKLSDEAVDHFHAQLDAESFNEILSESDPAFQKSESTEELIKFLAGVHSKLGTSLSQNRTNVFVNATTNGTFLTVNYRTAFEKGPAKEVFTWRKMGNNLKLVGYHVESNTFISQ